MCVVAAAFREAEVTIGARTVLGAVPVPSRPWEGVTGVSLFSVSCSEMGTYVSVPPKPHHLERSACRPGGTFCAVRVSPCGVAATASGSYEPSALSVWEPDFILATSLPLVPRARLVAPGQATGRPQA